MPIDSWSSKNSKRTAEGKQEKFGRNTIRAVTKPFVGFTKGIGKGVGASSDVMTHGFIIGDDGIDSVIMLGAGTVTIPVCAAYGLAHGAFGLASSAVQGTGNLLRLRTPQDS